jgi:hypothetical protein
MVSCCYLKGRAAFFLSVIVLSIFTIKEEPRVKEFSLNVGEGKYHVCLHTVFCGKDVVLCIVGGNVPHIGAVAVAVPRKSLTGDGSHSASVSVICITGHKEDELARSIALRLSSKWLCNVTVSAGIHIEDAKKEDIAILNKNIEELIGNMTDKVNNEKQQGITMI